MIYSGRQELSLSVTSMKRNSEEENAPDMLSCDVHRQRSGAGALLRQ